LQTFVKHKFKRILGDYQGTPEGATVIFTAGIHGNETAGVNALLHVADILQQYQPPFKGRFLGLAGNLKALNCGERFIDIDLNRLWHSQFNFSEINDTPLVAKTYEEFHEKIELLNIFQNISVSDKKRIFTIDLHTTSSKSEPFTIVEDRDDLVTFALSFHAPVILGLLDYIKGSLIQYLDKFYNWTTLAFEAGQHNDESSYHRHIAAIWIALIEAGCITENDIPDPDYREYRDFLQASMAHLPNIFQVVYRYAIQQGEKFVMEPGFCNFQPIQKGQLLAKSNGKPIYAHRDGFIFMPLYQAKGDDGFFIIEEVTK
jgi:succinylglutamate desuccinylase